MADAEHVGGFRNPAFGILHRDAANLEAEAHVLAHRFVRIERVVLEDHGDVAFAWRQFVDGALADADLAIADRFQAGDHSERR